MVVVLLEFKIEPALVETPIQTFVHTCYVPNCIIHPASRGVAAHTAVVLRQFQGPERNPEACGHRIIFLLNNNPSFSTCEVPPNRCFSFFSPT